MMKLIDKDGGKWFVNRSQFRMPHGTREGVYFEPGDPVCIRPDAWIKGQGEVFQEVSDPNGEMPASITSETPLKDNNLSGRNGQMAKKR